MMFHDDVMIDHDGTASILSAGNGSHFSELAQSHDIDGDAGLVLNPVEWQGWEPPIPGSAVYSVDDMSLHRRQLLLKPVHAVREKRNSGREGVPQVAVSPSRRSRPSSCVSACETSPVNEGGACSTAEPASPPLSKLQAMRRFTSSSSRSRSRETSTPNVQPATSIRMQAQRTLSQSMVARDDRSDVREIAADLQVRMSQSVLTERPADSTRGSSAGIVNAGALSSSFALHGRRTPGPGSVQGRSESRQSTQSGAGVADSGVFFDFGGYAAM